MRPNLLIVPLIALAACTPPRPALAPLTQSADTSVRPREATLLRARELGAGAYVSTVGVVSVPSGAVDAGFALRDGWYGLYVAADSAVRMPAGRWVKVTGKLADQHGLLVLRPERIDSMSTNEPDTALAKRTGDIGEATESAPVTVRGRITGPVVDDRPYGWKIMIDDGSGPIQVFVPAHQPFDPSLYRPGQMLRAEGMSAQYDSTYEVITTVPLQIIP